eukprot:GHRR01012331.1.p2 GENE.GHRR01012331.1~~GHRR01012331.1.p2  ORF type:complete len:312 (+),score=148.50 GHRR01012331.1:3165-4100(+)
MPAQTNPIMDPSRIYAEDLEQARHFYHSIVKDNALNDGSADVFARNTCSSVEYTASIRSVSERQPQVLPQLQQSSQQQEAGGSQGSGKQHKASIATIARKGKENGVLPATSPVAASPAAASATTSKAAAILTAAVASAATPPKRAVSAACAAPAVAAAVAAGAGSGHTVANAGSGKVAAQKAGNKSANSIASLWKKRPAKPLAGSKTAAVAATGSQPALQDSLTGTGPAMPAGPATAAAPEAEPAAVGTRLSRRQRSKQRVVDEDDECFAAKEQQEEEQRAAKRPRGRFMIGEGPYTGMPVLAVMCNALGI